MKKPITLLSYQLKNLIEFESKNNVKNPKYATNIKQLNNLELE